MPLNLLRRSNSVIIFLFALTNAFGSVYEGFDMTAKSGSAIGGSDGALSGQTSTGWHSSWQALKGKSVVSGEDLRIKGLESTPGALLLRGERKNRSIGQGVAMRQISESHTGDVYGSFRFKSGNLIQNSILGVLFSLPDGKPVTPRNALFAVCPKRWASSYGMLGAGQKHISKIENGVECYADETYLVVWKFENLPAPGKRGKIRLMMWVLDARQAAHFASNGFSESDLRQAEQGVEAKQVSQSIGASIPNSKRGIHRGIVISCFSSGVAKVLMDELRVSSESLADAVGLSQ